MSTSQSLCSLCKESYPSEESLIICKCNHQCCKCIVNYITSNFGARIKCPFLHCPQSIFDPIIRKCLSNNQINNYEQLCISGTANCRKCPIAQCPFFYMFDGEFGIFICEYCEAPICLKCNNIHYPNAGGTCSVDKSFDDKALETIKRKKREELFQMDNKYKLLPNTEKFDCSFCTDIILPREGVTLRNCLHRFCQRCLRDTYSNKNFVNQLKCQTCNTRLDDRELCALIDEKVYTSMVEKEATNLWYHCKTIDCTGVWHISGVTASHQCPICKTVNCLRCAAIHTDMSCAEYHLSSSFINDSIDLRTLTVERRINCYYCKEMLNQEGGCGALYCSLCGRHTCVFTGLFAGNHDPKECGCWIRGTCNMVDKYCKCTSKKPCDTLCLFGCYPEG